MRGCTADRQRRRRAVRSGFAAAALAAIAATPAYGVPGDIIVSDSTTFGPNNGGLIKVDPVTGARTTLTENNAPAGGAALESPNGIAFEAGGSIVVADSWSVGGVRTPRVVRVDPSTGVRTLVSDNANPVGGPSFVEPTGIAVEADGSILVSDISAGTNNRGAIIRVDPATGARTLVSRSNNPSGAPRFTNPWDLGLDGSGDIIVVDADSPQGTGGKVIRVDPVTGTRTLISRNGNPAGGPDFFWPWWIAVAGSTILVSDQSAFGGTGGVISVDPATGARTRVSRNTNPAGAPLFSGPADLARKNGDIVMNNSGADAVIGVDRTTGLRSTISDNTSPPGAPTFATNWGIAVQPLSLVAVVIAPGGVIDVPGGGGGGGGGGDRPPDQDGHRAAGAAAASLRFRLGQAARVTVRIQRLQPGRVVGRFCRPQTVRNRRGARCRAVTQAATLSLSGRRGANRTAFADRLGGRRLPAGSYRAVLQARDRGGNESIPVGVRFTVVRQAPAS